MHYRYTYLDFSDVWQSMSGWASVRRHIWHADSLSFLRRVNDHSWRIAKNTFTFNAVSKNWGGISAYSYSGYRILTNRQIKKMQRVQEITPRLQCKEKPVGISAASVWPRLVLDSADWIWPRIRRTLKSYVPSDPTRCVALANSISTGLFFVMNICFSTICAVN